MINDKKEKLNVVWRDAIGWEGFYQVNNLGQVRSVDRVIHKSDGTIQTFKSREINGFKSSAGYMLVRLNNTTNGKRVCESCHRLVAMAFIENPLNKPEVNHIDGVKHNNLVENLEWVTSRKNRKHAWDTGLRNRSHLPIHRGEEKTNAKLSIDKVIEMRKLKENGESYQAIAKKYGVAKKTAMSAIKGETWSCANIYQQPKP